MGCEYPVLAFPFSRGCVPGIYRNQYPLVGVECLLTAVYVFMRQVMVPLLGSPSQWQGLIVIGALFVPRSFRLFAPA